MNAGEEEEEEEARVIERMNECEIVNENEGPKKGNATTSRDESNRDDDSTNDGLYRGPLTLDERVNLCLSIGEECIQPDELRRLLEKKPNPIAYDGFEPSGRMHIAQGVMKCLNVNKLTKSGVTFKFWIADWFAQMNNKMGGDIKKIQKVGMYMVEVWKAVGMDLTKVEFIWSSEEINSRASEYWPLVLDIARKNSLGRIIRCSQIMGRSESDELAASQIFYPVMQCADIFFLKADICQLGMDQRKVNMLAREYCDDIKRKNKPIILSHKMLAGLKEGQEKMSKSDPNSAIFMEDSEKDVEAKIKKAFCPPGIVEKNPCLEYIKYVIFPWCEEFKLFRKDDSSAESVDGYCLQIYSAYESFEKDYVEEKIHPGDLKPSLSKHLNAILQPVRDHFENDENAKNLLKTIKGYKVTK
jgi:tyrosyl-tRNA synthetase